MSNQNDLVIVRRGDVEALKQEAIFGVFRRDAVEFDKLNALLANAPVVSGEFGISFMKYTEFGVVPDDYKNQAGGYRAGWNDCIASVKYTITTPQPLKRLSDADIEAMIYEHTKFNVNIHEDGETVIHIKNLANAIMDKMEN